MTNKNKNQTIVVGSSRRNSIANLAHLQKLGIVKTNGSIRVPLQVKAENGTLFTPVPNNIALSVVNPKW